MRAQRVLPPFDRDAEVVAAEIVAEATARARSEVLEWLVPKLAEAYRREVSKHLAEDRSGDSRVGHYLYGIAETDKLAPPSGLLGIDAEPVTMIDTGGLSALTSAVDLFRFQATDESDDLPASGWLAHAVRAHESVVEHSLGRVPVLPMRFGTVYSSESAVTDALQQHRSDLRSELARLGTATEWGVKICTSDTERGGPGEPGNPGNADRSGSGVGTAWMLARQSALSSRQQQTARIAACVDHVRTRMRTHAREESMTATSNRSRTELLNMSYLVDDRGPFCETFESLRQQHLCAGLELRMTGPWPPYHFVRISQLRGDGGE